MKIHVPPHPQLYFRCFVTEFSQTIGHLTTPASVLELFSTDAKTPFESSDAQGPYANAFKDSQRTKTNPRSKRVLTLMWGTQDLSDRVGQVESWYRSLLEPLGSTLDVEL